MHDRPHHKDSADDQGQQDHRVRALFGRHLVHGRPGGRAAALVVAITISRVPEVSQPAIGPARLA
jgi:hypothetical protein